jgi:multidrug resistance protein
VTRNPLIPVFLIVAVDVLGLTIVIPLLPFFAERFGASPFVVGLLVSAYAVCQLISGPILGQLSDRFGRRPVLIASQIGTFIGFIILARASALWVVFLSRFIDGSTAGNLSVAQAYIADVTPAENRAKSFGIIGIAFGLGFLVGPAVSGYLSHFGFEYPIYAAAGLSFLSILGTVFLLKEPPTHVSVAEERKLGLFEFGAYGKDFRNPRIGATLVQLSVYFLGFAIFLAGFAMFAERRFTIDGLPFGPREVGYVFAFSGTIGIFVQGGLVGRMVKRFGEEKTVVFGFASALVGYVILAFAQTIPGLLLSAAFSSFGGLLRPALTALVSKQAGPREQGRMMGLVQGLNSMSSIVGPIIAGLLIDQGWLTVWALVMAATSVCGLALIARVIAKSNLAVKTT